MNDQERKTRIFFIVETELRKRDLTKPELRNLNTEVGNLIEDLEDSTLKNQVVEKLNDKKRFSSIINDTGIKDFTGYGHHFW